MRNGGAGMIVWSRLGRRLEMLARRSPADAVLSIGVELPAPPAAAFPAGVPWFRWQRPDARQVLTGVGETLTIDSAGAGRFAALGAAWNGLSAAWRHDDAGGPPPLAFAGFAFGPDGGAPFPNASLAVPTLLLREDDGRCRASFSCTAAAAAEAVPAWRELWENLGVHAAGNMPPRLAKRPAPLEEQAFLARGRAALAAIEGGEIEKLVLTRRVRFEAETPVCAWPVLDALAAANPACAVWAVGRGEEVFLGASPERLLELRGDAVAADALAGTAWWGGAGASPYPPLDGDKNRREHELVTAAVAEALAPLCDDVVIPAAPEIMSVQNIRHLRRRITARRRSGVGAFDLLARLHPTPAVGGTPTAAAVDWLAARGDRRGAWYTGGIGWLGADGSADFAVALRCGLIRGREITLYAGAGFVRGSDAQQEFAETEAKLAPMLAALSAAGTTEVDASTDMTGT